METDMQRKVLYNVLYKYNNEILMHFTAGTLTGKRQKAWIKVCGVELIHVQPSLKYDILVQNSYSTWMYILSYL